MLYYRPRPVRGLRFKRLTFAHTTWTRPSEVGHPVLQAQQFSIPPTAGNQQHVGRHPAVLTIAHATDVPIEGCVFRSPGATALDFAEAVSASVAVGNAFADIAGNGVALGVFSPPEVEAHTPLVDADPAAQTREVRIADNFITRIGRDHPGGCRIVAGHVRNVVIENNENFETPYTGISLGRDWNRTPGFAAGNVIRGNRVHRVMQLLADCGTIDTLPHQPHGQISENHTHGIAPSVWAGEVGVKAIYLDEGGGGSAEQPLVVRRNVVSVEGQTTRYNLHRTGISLWEGELWARERWRRLRDRCDGRSPVSSSRHARAPLRGARPPEVRPVIAPRSEKRGS